jgi:hypothetical protein
MDINGLIKNLETLSDILKSKPVRESVNLNDFKNSYDRFEAALSDLKSLSKASKSTNRTALKSILEVLGETVAELDKIFGYRLDLLKFVSEIKVLQSVQQQ